jgi:hypothetical protein
MPLQASFPTNFAGALAKCCSRGHARQGQVLKNRTCVRSSSSCELPQAHDPPRAILLKHHLAELVHRGLFVLAGQQGGFWPSGKLRKAEPLRKSVQARFYRRADNFEEVGIDHGVVKFSGLVVLRLNGRRILEVDTLEGLLACVIAARRGRGEVGGRWERAGWLGNCCQEVEIETNKDGMR